MITKATSINVTTTPMRMPRTGVNSKGTGLSEINVKIQELGFLYKKKIFISLLNNLFFFTMLQYSIKDK